jgi:LmbE family N-acetylglucosaminyl deacetylase
MNELWRSAPDGMKRRNKAARPSPGPSAIVAVWLIVIAMILPAPPPGTDGAAHAQVRPRYERGVIGLAQALGRLQTIASVMHTGAHPDDEDSALIARLARGDHARVSYLSLNRGEGGQNIIGGEQGEALGVIRTEELLQARRLDGGEQFFTRVTDFGFSKTRAEAAQKWGERAVLADMVEAIRRFRPLVIISRFAGTPADGHGHHQLAGHLTPIAFKAAADPAQFPDRGIPWRAKKLYVSEGFAPDPENRPTLRIPTGVYDPALGGTYYQIAMEGRSQHKSQEMGSLELNGDRFSGVRLLAGPPGGDAASEKSVFDGLDVRLSALPLATELTEVDLSEELKSAESGVSDAIRSLSLLAPQKCVSGLINALQAFQKADVRLADAARRAPTPSMTHARFFLERKMTECRAAILLAAGVTVEAVSDREVVAPGETTVVTAQAFAPPGAPAVWLGTEMITGWKVQSGDEPPPSPKTFRLTAPAFAPPPPSGIRPFPENPATATFRFGVDGTEFSVTQPVEYRYADPVRGEVRREISVVPPLAVRLDRGILLAPRGEAARSYRLVWQAESFARRPISGTASLSAPPGWKVEPPSAPFEISSFGERRAIPFTITVPADAPLGAHGISARATVSGASGTPEVLTQSVQTISYPHIQTRRIVGEATTTVQVLDVKVAPVAVGYVMGSGDAVPDAIRRLGLGVTTLDEVALSTGDLSRFDVIVVGVRASQVRSDFAANNGRLLEFVRQGGTLIVQYQRPDYVQRGLAPFPATMFTRTTDETAKVTILQPNHPAFTFPNAIVEDDWKGWVQERSLYDFTTFDARYTPLLESHDPGESEHRGGELYAEIGRGKYVYTSYAWFRQLPAGVPGAYRLFANLLSLPKAAQ